MQRADDLAVFVALILALFAAFASSPQAGTGFERRLLALLSIQALAVDMPQADADGETLFVSP